MIDLVKSGDIEAVLSKQQVYNIEVRDVTDIGQFNQNLVFSSVFIQNEEQIIKMMTVLIQMGVDLFQKDNLKQTSLYYACRDGKCKVIQFLVEQGIRVNDKDTYGQNAIYYAVNLG
jgi:ankyrin repeat protein